MPTLNWQKSSYSSEGNNCVELATDPATPGTVHLRESDAPATVLTTTASRLAALLAATRTGTYTSITPDQQ